MLFQCWLTLYDAGPTLKQKWLDASLPQNKSQTNPVVLRCQRVY